MAARIILMDGVLVQAAGELNSAVKAGGSAAVPIKKFVDQVSPSLAGVLQRKLLEKLALNSRPASFEEVMEKPGDFIDPYLQNISSYEGLVKWTSHFEQMSNDVKDYLKRQSLYLLYRMLGKETSKKLEPKMIGSLVSKIETSRLDLMDKIVDIAINKDVASVYKYIRQKREQGKRSWFNLAAPETRDASERQLASIRYDDLMKAMKADSKGVFSTILALDDDSGKPMQMSGEYLELARSLLAENKPYYLDLMVANDALKPHQQKELFLQAARAGNVDCLESLKAGVTSDDIISLMAELESDEVKAKLKEIF